MKVGGQPTLVIGVGNRDRGDDAAGPLVIDAIRSLTSTDQPATLVIEGDLSDLPLRWSSDDRVVIVDAAVTGAPLGTIRRFDVTTGFDALRGLGRALSSHGISLSDGIELAHLLGRRPRHLAVITIEAESFEHFDPPSPEVLAAVELVAAELAI